MGQIIWTLGIIVLALRINHDEAKAHQPPAVSITTPTDTTSASRDTVISIQADTAHVTRP